MDGDVLHDELKEKQRTLIGPVQIFEDQHDGSLSSRALKETANCISQTETGGFFIRNGRTLADADALAQLRDDGTDVSGARPTEGTQVVRGLVLDECPESLCPRPIRRRPFAITRSTPEDARASPGRYGREFPGKCRLANPWLTGNQHDLSAPAQRAVERTTQLG
jgi:hypothetical protein